MVNESLVTSALAQHPYDDCDRIKIGGVSKRVKVFRLGSSECEILYRSGNPSVIASVCCNNDNINRVGLIVDGTEVYVLKETTPNGAVSRNVVFESNAGKQIKGSVDSTYATFSYAGSVTPTDYGTKFVGNETGDYDGQIKRVGSTTMIWSSIRNQWYSCDSAIVGYNDEGVKSQSNPVWGRIELARRYKTTSAEAGEITFDFNIRQDVNCIFTGSAVLMTSINSSTHTWDTTDTSNLSVTSHQTKQWMSASVNTPMVLGTTDSIRFDACVDYVTNDGAVPYYKIWLVFAGYPNANKQSRCPKIVISNIQCDEDYVPQYGMQAVAGILGEDSTTIPSSYANPLSAHGNIKYNISVPISTSTDQMLISDGNGGWKVQDGTNDGYRTWSFFVTNAYSSNKIFMKWCGLWKKTKNAKKMPISIPFKLTMDTTNEWRGVIYFTFIPQSGSTAAFVNPMIIWEGIQPTSNIKNVFEKMQLVTYLGTGSDDNLYCELWTSSTSSLTQKWYTISYEINGRFIHEDRGGFCTHDKHLINHRLDNLAIRDAMDAGFAQYTEKCNGVTPDLEATISHYFVTPTAI